MVGDGGSGDSVSSQPSGTDIYSKVDTSVEHEVDRVDEIAEEVEKKVEGEEESIEEDTETDTGCDGAFSSTSYFKLKKKLMSESQMNEKGKTIVSSEEFMNADKIAEIYGGEPEDWVKKSS